MLPLLPGQRCRCRPRWCARSCCWLCRGSGTPHIGVFVRLKNSVRNSSRLPAPADREAAEDREVDVPVAGSAELVAAGVPECAVGGLAERRRVEIELIRPMVADDLVFAVQVRGLPGCPACRAAPPLAVIVNGRARHRAVDAVDLPIAQDRLRPPCSGPTTPCTAARRRTPC